MLFWFGHAPRNKRPRPNLIPFPFTLLSLRLRLFIFIFFGSILGVVLRAILHCHCWYCLGFCPLVILRLVGIGFFLSFLFFSSSQRPRMSTDEWFRAGVWFWLTDGERVMFILLCFCFCFSAFYDFLSLPLFLLSTP